MAVPGIMRAIWKGVVSFGLVTIPIALYRATRREELKFRFLRKGDLSPVNYKRVAEVDNKEVPWDQIVRGYEHEKGRFVVLSDEDFKRVDIEATQTVEIMNFVELKEIDPIFFATPYYMESQKGGDKAYVLLRETLNRTGKVGIANVVIKTRQHLAAVKPRKEFLTLELMHYCDEIIPANEVLKPPKEVTPSSKELEMATTLVRAMTEKWKPEKYTDEYRDALQKVIEEKIKRGGAPLPVIERRGVKPGKVIDLVSVLQQSLKESRKPARKKAA